MTFGERLVHYRARKNLSQKALAELLNITPTRLNYWEKDKREPDVEMIKRLSSALDVSANILIGYEEDPETKKAPTSEEVEAKASVSMEQSNRLFDALVSSGLIVEDDLAAEDIQFLGSVADIVLNWFARKHQE